MPRLAVLPADWRTLPSWTLLDLRREIRVYSKELEERNDLLRAAAAHRALAALDEHLNPILSRPPTPEEWAEASAMCHAA